ncbi:VWA domain-containing protein [Microbacterium sp. SSW1-59]|uniref:VWA domain-containing protein n=1 Tax=Microbacterium xanthum TaxID=3079794 RepID=UPI002AD34A0B|nr:VWA domain-containing protein [Microbacterium sp. SSW1-59]MDZ8201478.1 VWA domain-containing protein [Microbacterium sp. SSW1-59]
MHRAHPNAPSTDAPSPGPYRRPVVVLAVVVFALLVALVAVVTVMFARGAATATAPSEADPPGCLPAEIRVTTDPALADVVDAVAADLAAAGAACPPVTITVEPSRATAASLAAGDAPTFDLWIPDSAMWPAWAAAQAERTETPSAGLLVGPTVATSPVVFATTAETAATLGDAPGFATVAGGEVATVMADPGADASSAAALLGLQVVLGGDARAFTALALALDTAATSSASEALAAAGAATSPTLAVTTEHALRAADSSLTAVLPADVTPVVRATVVTPEDANDQAMTAVEQFAGAMVSSPELLAAHGWRGPDGEAFDSATTDVDTAADPAGGANEAEALRTWQMLTAPSRMLSLNDVSGSMREPVTADMRRIDLFEQAAVRAINSLSDDSSLATWVFSSRRIGGQDWQEIDPFGPLGDAAHKERVIETANGLDRLVGGGTGLYDSVLAAVTYMRETYEPDRVNLVLLNTDGLNEDDQGLDLPELLVELEKLRDPSRPVAVIAIGYGPDTDQAALEQIAAATDGAAYQALEPTDIGTVLVDAVTQRGCRPNCG